MYISLNLECNRAIAETSLNMLCIYISFSSLFFFLHSQSLPIITLIALCAVVSYDNYLFGVTLEGAAMQSGWGVHERVMEDDINVLLSFYPMSKVSHSPLWPQERTHAHNEMSHLEEVIPMLCELVEKWPFRKNAAFRIPSSKGPH